MGLRDYLSTLGGIAESSKSLLSSTEEMRKQAAQKDFTSMAPELIRQGKLEDVASLAYAAGDKAPMNTLVEYNFKNELAKQATNKDEKPFSLQELTMMSLPTGQAEAISKMPFKNQKEAFNVLGDAAKLAANNVSEARRERSIALTRGMTLAKEVGPVRKQLLEDKTALDKVDAAYATKSFPGDNIVMNFIARKMADEKGPLNEGDIKRIAGKTFYNDYESAKNYITGLTGPTASPEMRNKYKELVGIARANYETNKESKVINAIRNAATANVELVADGVPSQELQKFAKEFGYQGVTVNSDGNIEFAKSSNSAPVSIKDKEGRLDFSTIIKQAKLIRDPEIRDQIIEAINKNLENSKKSGKAIRTSDFQKYWDSKVTPFLPKE